MTLSPYPAFKPSAPRTLGTLSIVFGSIAGVLSVFGLLVGTQFGMMMQPDGSQREAFERYANDIHAVGLANNFAFLVMSVALIYVGIGQRKYARWAAAGSVKWGVAALCWLVVYAVLHFTVVMPAMDRFIEAIAHRLDGLPMGGIMKFSSVLALAIYAPYPIILIATFRKPQIVAAMTEPSLPTAIVHASPGQ